MLMHVSATYCPLQEESSNHRSTEVFRLDVKLWNRLKGCNDFILCLYRRIILPRKFIEPTQYLKTADTALCLWLISTENSSIYQLYVSAQFSDPFNYFDYYLQSIACRNQVLPKWEYFSFESLCCYSKYILIVHLFNNINECLCNQVFPYSLIQNKASLQVLFKWG